MGRERRPANPHLNGTPDADTASTTSGTVGSEPADAPALAEGVEASADASERGSHTGSIESTTGTDAPPVPTGTLEPASELDAAYD